MRVLLIALLALTACREAAPELPPVGPEAVAVAREACLKRGGSYAPGGMGGALVCFTTPRDAGKACTRESDCESACLARSRTCAPVVPLLGCNEILTQTGAEMTLCVD